MKTFYSQIDSEWKSESRYHQHEDYGEKGVVVKHA